MEKWKEKYDEVVVDCHHSLHLWMKIKTSLPKKFFFFFFFFGGGGGGGGETLTSPWVPFWAKFKLTILP